MINTLKVYDVHVFAFQYFGGHVASTNIPADMIYITSRLRAVRPDGKPNVPMWVWTDIVRIYA